MKVPWLSPLSIPKSCQHHLGHLGLRRPLSLCLTKACQDLGLRSSYSPTSLVCLLNLCSAAFCILFKVFLNVPTDCQPTDASGIRFPWACYKQQMWAMKFRSCHVAASYHAKELLILRKAVNMRGSHKFTSILPISSSPCTLPRPG